MSRLVLVRVALLCVMLVGSVLQPFTGTSAAATPTAQTAATNKVVVDSDDRAALERVRAANGTLLADYGSFTLWRVSATTTNTLRGRDSIAVRNDLDTIFLRNGALNTVASANPTVGTALRQTRAASAQLWLVQFVGPVQDDWLVAIERAGARIVDFLPSTAFVVWADGAALARIEAMKRDDAAFVQWTGAYHPSYRLAPQLTGATGTVTVTVQFYTAPDVSSSLDVLPKLGATQIGAPERVLDFTNVRVRLPAAQLATVAALPDVFNVEPWIVPVLMDERQNQIIAGTVVVSGTKTVPSGPGYLQWLADLGFPTNPNEYPIVDVVDDGVDNGTVAPNNPEFFLNGATGQGSRVVAVANCTNDATANGLGGHGNINASIVGGYSDRTGAAYVDGPSSGIPGGYRYGLGVAPYTRLANTKIFANAGNYSITKCDSSEAGVVERSYAAGAAITSNSWGSGSNAYDSSAQLYDVLTRDASATTAGGQPMAHIFAAGNDGSRANTVGSPGTAKNVITVGATENVRADGFMDGCNIATADNADDIASYSSRGPTRDGRAKPDIVAPGSHVIGAATQVTGYIGDGVCDRYFPAGQTLYAMSTGTSHSTPAVSGAASLLYTYYRRTVGGGTVVPSPAMLKAYLLNSTRYLTGVDANDTLPSIDQGWGDVYLKQAFDGTAREFYDQSTDRTLGATGEVWTQSGVVASTGQPVRVTLAWTDAPGATTGNASVNDLNLEVTVGGTTYKGNVFNGATSAPGGTADAKNNVENVYLPAGTSGIVSVKVTAANIAGDGVPGNADTTDQDWALVVYNQTQGPIGTIKGTVRSSDGVPVADAVVSGGGAYAVTGADGTFASTAPASTYQLVATKGGFTSPTQTVVVTENGTTTQDFTLQATTVRGTVRSSFGARVAGARVSGDGVLAVADANGVYTTLVAPGSYTLSATSAGTSSAPATVRVVAGTTVAQDFTILVGALVGSVVDAVSRVPLAGATVSAAAQTATTDSAGRYALAVSPGATTVVATRSGYDTARVAVVATAGVTLTRHLRPTPLLGLAPTTLHRVLPAGQTISDTLAVVNTRATTSTVTIKETRPLLVVSSRADAIAATSASLNALGYRFDAIDRATFQGAAYPQAKLHTYGALLWMDTSVAADITKLTTYLDGGGRLFVSDNIFVYSNRTRPFLATYLGVATPGYANLTGPLTGAGILAGFEAASVDISPDHLTVNAPAVPILSDGSSTPRIRGSAIERNTYRAVLVSTDIRDLGTTALGEAVETDLIGRVLAWLVPQTDVVPWITATPTTATLAPGARGHITIGWDASALASGVYPDTLVVQSTAAPTMTTSLPVRLTVRDAAALRSVGGTVTATTCGDAPAPLSEATVTLASNGVVSQVFTNRVDGTWQGYVEPGTYILSVSAQDHATTTATIVVGSEAVTRDLMLPRETGCATTPTAAVERLVGTNGVATATITITNDGGFVLPYTIGTRTADANACVAGSVAWLSATPSSGSLEPGANAALLLRLDAAGLGTGVYNTTLCVANQTTNAPARTIPVTLAVDATGPAAPTGVLAPAANAAGWNNTPVAVSWTPNGDPGAASSGVAACTTATHVSAETGGTTVAGRCTDGVGNTGAAGSATVRIDRTPPVVTGRAEMGPNGSGWHNRAVTVVFSASDGLLSDGSAGSGVVSLPNQVQLTTDGANQRATGTAMDAAGNTGSGTVGGINIDTQRPTTTASLACTGANDFCRGDTATLVLTATDQAGLAGIRLLRWSINNGPEQIITSTTTEIEVPLSGVGRANVRYSAVDRAGNYEVVHLASIRYDTLAPTVGAVLSPAPNAAGWNNTSTTVQFKAKDQDGGSNVDPASLTPDVVVQRETAGRTLVGQARDTAGNTGTVTATVRLDMTRPSAPQMTVSPAPNAAGWNRGAVTVRYDEVGDQGTVRSGIASCTAQVGLVKQTSGAVVGGTCVDTAGNVSTPTRVTVRIDIRTPVVQVVGVEAGKSYAVGNVPQASCVASDMLSGVAVQPTLATSTTRANGLMTVTVTCQGATDVAGNVADPVRATYTVRPRWDGFKAPLSTRPVVNRMRAGRAVPVRFSLGGDFGLAVLAGEPRAGFLQRDPAATVTDVTETTTATTSALSYNSATGVYTYLWATPPSYAGTRRMLVLTLASGDRYAVDFEFTP